ncbi:DNA-binding IclR family transcriptional regulator [Microbacterium foliorum]|uniref:DNA-binding IclR family transcriptional regulator n=1 Tax=Microbacterium foliorum TaxID=104336 RepID=A0ABU1HVK7_9MICO|nr:IclR family transcriptional regulator [Microbacterium foliorum]MDR6144084.1 DNA-binding IclR family transcriptional regulator [Microbacterium foliorum]
MANSRSGDSMTDRVVRVLDTFSTETTTQTNAEIARRAGLSLSTAHRIVADLIRVGLLERDEERRIRLGMRLWELALRGSSALRLRQAALPHMELVQERLREHTQLSVLEHEEALFLERLSHPDAGANITRIAGRLPVHASSSGLVLLAHADPAVRIKVLTGPLRALSPETVTDRVVLESLLRRIRRQGFVIAAGTIETVSTGVAVPIRDRGSVVAALSCILPRTTETATALTTLRAAAKGIEADLVEN